MHKELVRLESRDQLDSMFSSGGFGWNYGALDPATRAIQRRRALDLRKKFENPANCVGLDAASGGGLAFLASQLELPEVKLVEPLVAVTHARDIPIKTGGGFVEELTAWASNYGDPAGNNYGLQANKNQDIGIIQVEVLKAKWPAFVWQKAFRVNYIDLQKLITAKRSGIPMPYSLEQLMQSGLNIAWNKMLDKITYQGFLNNYGLMNNTAITSTQAPATGTGNSPLWSTKTSNQILNDINYGILTCQENSGYDVKGIPNRMLVDFEHWSVLNQPMTTGGFNSILEYCLMNNVARRQGIEFDILPLPDPWISTAGTGGTSEALFYHFDEDNLYLKIPQPMTKIFTVPTVQGGGAYETLFSGCVGVPQILRSQTMLYLYGI